MPQLVLLGCELCGVYMPAGQAMGTPGVGGEPSPTGGASAIMPSRSRPLATPASIAAFLESAPGLRGRRAAMRSLPYVLAGAASPMESVLALLLCLPRRHGGLGLPRPQLNRRVDLDGQAWAVSGRRYHVVDMLWEGAGLGAEYDGRLAHIQARSFDDDRRRANALKMMGVDLVNFTADHIRDDRLLVSQASYIARRLRVRERELGKGWASERATLRRELLGSDGRSAGPVWPGARQGLPRLIDVLDARQIRQ